MKRLRKGDKVKRKDDTAVGEITSVRERGVAGSSCTYLEWVEVTYTNGLIIRCDPALLVRAE